MPKVIIKEAADDYIKEIDINRKEEYMKKVEGASHG